MSDYSRPVQRSGYNGQGIKGKDYYEAIQATVGRIPGRIHLPGGGAVVVMYVRVAARVAAPPAVLRNKAVYLHECYVKDRLWTTSCAGHRRDIVCTGE